MYTYTDKVIELLDKNIQKQFSQFANTVPADELNVLNGTKSLYKRLAKKAKMWYNMIAEYYISYFDGADSLFSDDIVTDYLEEYDPVTKYVYDHEIKRKQAYLAEALIASPKTRDAEIRRAKRLFMLMTHHYADAITDRTQVFSYKSRGIKYVQWLTEADQRVCEECRRRNKKIYPIDNIPAKPHYGCRCRLAAATKEQYERSKTAG